MEPTGSRIHRLSSQTANQIAAGEVVERPASVAKELLENSLDAGATRIDVQAEGGGVKLLRVRDDGAGIHPEDLNLALSRHATSKIADHRDLLGIATLGFRGEALASIASVSRFTMVSRARGEESGWRLEAGGKPVPSAHPVGTTVEVRDLFFSVPARRKFLRAERTEFSHLEDVIKRVALSRFDLAISLEHNGRTVLSLPAVQARGRPERRLSAVLGRPFVAHARAVAFEAAGLRLRGWVGAREYSRSHADLQYFYLNGRVIRDRLINHAIRHAYSDVVEAGRHPAFLLYLDMDPRQVDVNVHPTKHEVRFREARLVHDFIHRGVRGALEQEPELPLSPAPSEARTRAAGVQAPAEVLPSPGGPAPMFPTRPTGAVAEVLGGYATLAAPAESPVVAIAYLAVIEGRFVVGRGTDGLVVVDSRVSERERLRMHLRHSLAEGALKCRPLLAPVSLVLKRAWKPLVEQQAASRYGLELEPLGPDTAALRTVPAVLRGDGAAAEIASAVLEHLAEARGEQALTEHLAEHLASAQPCGPEEGRRLLNEVANGTVPAAAWQRLDAHALGRLFAEPAP